MPLSFRSCALRIVLFCVAAETACATNGGSGGGGAGMTGTTGAAGGGGAAPIGAAGTTGTSGAPGKAGTTGDTGEGGGAAATSGGGAAGATGTPGSAGTTGTGGTAGGAGTGATGSSGTTGAAGTGASVACTIMPTASVSTKIATVGIVTFTTSLPNVTSGQIDFGLTTAYGMTAPVDLIETGYRTLLLGMKASKPYHYRITVSNASGSCQGADSMVTTGALPNGLMQVAVSPSTSSVTGLSGGFFITGQFVMGTANDSGSPAYILDADGDYVWVYKFVSDVGGARMSYDGKYMWINSTNVPATTAHVQRVTMDGMTVDDFSSKFVGQSHQLSIEPDETVAFYAASSNGCDDIKEFDPKTGTVKMIVNAQTAQQLGGGTMCHLNNVQYSKGDDSLVFSDLDSSTVVKIKRSDGSVIWNLNGSHKTITGASWTGGEHGLHLIDLNRLLIFNNNNTGGGAGSIAIEILLDLNAKTATSPWRYTATPGISNMIMGDLQRMPNGNTVIGYSTKGVVHEVNAAGTKLQSWTWPASGTFGYIEKRATLYGPPPR